MCSSKHLDRTSTGPGWERVNSISYTSNGKVRVVWNRCIIFDAICPHTTKPVRKDWLLSIDFITRIFFLATMYTRENVKF